LAEKWLIEWAAENNVTLSILRLPLLVGPNPRGNLEAMISGIRSGRYFSIGEANARKSMVWAEDIAKIVPVLEKKGGIYNLTDGEHPTMQQLETAIAVALKKSRPFKLPYWAGKALAVTGDVIGSRFPFDSARLSKLTSTLTFNDDRAEIELSWKPTRILTKIPEIIGS